MQQDRILPIEALSFWERKEYFEQIDFLIVGAGIVGCSSAYHLRQKYPKAKIIVVDRGFLPNGASTKNAGFACFGGPVELTDDLKTMEPQTVWKTVDERFRGLIYLREIIGDQYMDFQQHGGWDIITTAQKKEIAHETRQKLPELNKELYRITNTQNVFSEDKHSTTKFGLAQINTAFRIELEAQIDTAKMMKRYHQLLTLSDIPVLFGIKVHKIDKEHGSVQTSIGTIQATSILLTVNGFITQLLPDEKVRPARAQVLVTSPIQNLPFQGTFHHDSGFYYFRNFNQRVLLGGGRNLDIEGETSFEMKTTDRIQKQLEKMLHEVILPQQTFSIDYRWSGIMGIGQSKYPIVKKVSDKVAIGVRLGGIGVAIGSHVGKKIAELF